MLLDSCCHADTLTGTDLHLQISQSSHVEHDLLTLIPCWLKEQLQTDLWRLYAIWLEGSGKILGEVRKFSTQKSFFMWHDLYSDLKIASLIHWVYLQVTIGMHLLCSWLNISREHHRLFFLFWSHLHPYKNYSKCYYLTDELCAGNFQEGVLPQAHYQEKNMISCAFLLAELHVSFLMKRMPWLFCFLDLLFQLFIFPLPIFSHHHHHLFHHQSIFSTISETNQILFLFWLLIGFALSTKWFSSHLVCVIYINTDGKFDISTNKRY